MRCFVSSRRWKAHAPAAKLILLTHDCSEYLVHCLRTVPCHGLIAEAEDGLATLEAAVERVRNGLRMVSAGIAAVQARLRQAHDSFAKLLTDRHLEVLVCITHSLSDEEIADRLGCMPSNVHSHRQEIMRKLDIHNTPKLIGYGMEKGFGSAPLPPQRPRRPR